MSNRPAFDPSELQVIGGAVSSLAAPMFPGEVPPEPIFNRPITPRENLRLTFSVRSSVNQEKEDLLQQLRDLAAQYQGDYSQMGEYPAWEYKEDSKLRDTMVEVYRNMYGKEAEVVAIHAGLECGLLGEKLPGLDAVSIGPEMHDIHTSRERLGIASTKRTWEFVLEVLKAL